MQSTNTERGKFYLIEIGARGGNLISASIVPLVTGVDTYDYLIDKSLGKKCKEEISILKRISGAVCYIEIF